MKTCLVHLVISKSCMVPDEFPNFFEIFVRDNTTDDDLGIYRVLPRLTNANV